MGNQDIMGTYDDEKDSDEPSDAEAGDPGSSANSTGMLSCVNVEHGTLEHAQKFWFCFCRRMTANCRIRQVDEPKL